MSQCCAKQAACCHGAAILDKRLRERLFRKSMPSDLIRGWTGFAIGMPADIRVRCVNYGQRKLIDKVMLGGRSAVAESIRCSFPAQLGGYASPKMPAGGDQCICRSLTSHSPFGFTL